MQFIPPLIKGHLIRRYKRFLADITLEDGAEITAHCPNTGTMLSCSTPGSPVRLSVSDNPKRKYPHTLEMVKDNGTWVGVNTSRTNKLVCEAIKAGKIAEFMDIEKIVPEVKTSANTRLDLQLFHGGQTTFVEIKNCSLAIDDTAMFPDAITTRGTKHLEELIEMKQAGNGACIFYLVQRMDASSFSPAEHIDFEYTATLRKAKEKGVMVLAYQAQVTPEEITVVRSLPVCLDKMIMPDHPINECHHSAALHGHPAKRGILPF